MKRLLLCLALLVGVSVMTMPLYAQVRKAEKALKNNELQEALGFVDVALEKKPKDAKAYEVQGRIYQAMAAESTDDRATLFGQMVESFEMAAELDPKKMPEKVENNMRIAYITEFQRGIDGFNAAQNASDPNSFMMAAKYFEGCTIIAPDSTGPYVNWAFAMMSAGDDAAAIGPLEQALEHGGDDADVYNYLGRLYLTNDRAPDAVPLLETGSEKYPDNGELQDLLFNAYAMAGQNDRAVESYASAVAEQPDNKVYRYNFGALLLQNDEYEAAAEQFQEAIRIDSEYGDAQYNLGASYVNHAVAVNAEMTEIDDALRENRSSLAEDEIKAQENKIDMMAEQRRELFSMSVAPLEKAKMLYEASGTEVMDICRILFQAYVQTGENEKAETVQACAGY